MFNNVNFNISTNGLGTPLPGTDYISGLLFYSDATLPTGFTSSNRLKPIFSVPDAVNLGITNGSLGETKATSTITFTTKFTVADVIVVTCATIASTSPIATAAAAGTLTLCNYTAVTADAVSTTTSAAALAAAINAGTLVHGFTALAAVAVVTITAPAGQGIFLNSGTPYSATLNGTGVVAVVQNVIPGVASDIDILYYHISEFFRMQPKGKLWVGIYATADVGTWASITIMQNAALGEIKQLGIYQKSASFATSQCNGIQSVCTALETDHKPIVALLGGEISGTADLTSYNTNLTLLSDSNVTVVIGQDGAAIGFKLFKATGKSITNLGEALGALALAAVNVSWAWLGKFQVSTTELDTVAFANGQLWTSLSTGARTNLDTLGLTFLRKVDGLSGTYHNNPYTCVSPSNDYAFNFRKRTIYKAINSLRAVLLPETASPVLVNPNGTLTADTIAFYKGLGKQALDVMAGAGEISGYSIIIDPTQNVLATSNLNITAQIQPTGTANFITVNIGFTQVLTTTS